MACVSQADRACTVFQDGECIKCGNRPRRGDWMATYSGGRFWPLDPRPEEVSIQDIAHHLSMRCRYSGAVAFFYSVAEHSVIVSQYVPPQFAREALLHDAAEAYVGDMVRPLKHQPEMRGFRQAEDAIYPVIMERFGIESTEESRAAIEQADFRVTADEVEALMRNAQQFRDRYPELQPLGAAIAALPPAQAECVFLAQFDDLFPGWLG